MTEELKTLRSANMLDDFVIEQFRGLKDLSFRQLGMVNLLVGGNNSGKTSVLEALAVFSSPLDIGAWSSIARNREVRSMPAVVHRGLSAVEAVRWLFPQSANETGLNAAEISQSHFQLGCAGRWPVQELRAQCVSIRGIPPEPPRRSNKETTGNSGLVEDQGWLVSARIAPGQDLSAMDSVEAQLWPSLGFYRGENRTGPRLPSVTLAPYSHRSQPLQLRQFSELIEGNEKLAPIEILRVLDPDVLDLQIVTDKHTGTPTILVKHRRSGGVPMSVLGDGFRRALAIALSIPQARGGILLIDEIETALHVSFLQKLFSWLVGACETFDVQLFATTHSLEAVTAMVNATPLTSHVGITTFQLGRLGEPAKRYSSEMLTRLVRDRGLDIR